jgi:hypothetical protein
MFRFFQLRPHAHSGKILHHRQTSYPPVVLLLLVAVGLLGSFTVQTLADQPYIIPGPESDAVGIGATVNAPAPSQAPVIHSPSSGAAQSSPITVQGSCPKDTQVRVFKNDIFAGAALCDASQSFSVLIDLLSGSNAITAKAYNNLDKASPPSNTVNLTYSLPGLSSPAIPGIFAPVQTAVNQLLIRTDTYQHGAFPGQEMGWPITIIGGHAPYALSIGWGDGKTDLISRAADGTFTVKHTYDKVGSGYKGSSTIIIKATDSNGQHAYLQTVAIVNDGTVKNPTAPSGGILQIAWPLLVMLVLVVASFFWGERREKKILEKKGMLVDAG